MCFSFIKSKIRKHENPPRNVLTTFESHLKVLHMVFPDLKKCHHFKIIQVLLISRLSELCSYWHPPIHDKSSWQYNPSAVTDNRPDPVRSCVVTFRFFSVLHLLASGGGSSRAQIEVYQSVFVLLSVLFFSSCNIVISKNSFCHNPIEKKSSFKENHFHS